MGENCFDTRAWRSAYDLGREWWTCLLGQIVPPRNVATLRRRTLAADGRCAHRVGRRGMQGVPGRWSPFRVSRVCLPPRPTIYVGLAHHPPTANPTAGPWPSARCGGPLSETVLPLRCAEHDREVATNAQAFEGKREQKNRKPHARYVGISLRGISGFITSTSARSTQQISRNGARGAVSDARNEMTHAQSTNVLGGRLIGRRRVTHGDSP